VALDGSQSASKALTMAIDLAVRYGATLHLVHVIPRRGPVEQAIEDLPLLAECSREGEWEGRFGISRCSGHKQRGQLYESHACFSLERAEVQSVVTRSYEAVATPGATTPPSGHEFGPA